MHNFTSVADAIEELVDNCVNFAWGQRVSVEISINRAKDMIVVEGDGGRGMGAPEINTWLNWGAGDKHGPDDLSRYHQGGKAACGYLGRSVRIYAKRQGSPDVWFLEDDDWGTRTEPRDFGVPEPLSVSAYPATFRDLAEDRGHVRIEISRLNRSRREISGPARTRNNIDDLRRSLASTYRVLLEQDQVEISIENDERHERVEPLQIPIMAGTRIEIPTMRFDDGRIAYGWAGRVNLQLRDSRSSVRSGIRLVQNGRLIRDNEWFGYNYQGKGALNSLVGELIVSRFTPTPNKTDFVERGDEVWEMLGERVLSYLQPLIADLRAGGPDLKVTRREKDLAQEVRQELGRVFAKAGDPSFSGGETGEEGQEIAREGRARASNRGTRRPDRNRRGPIKRLRQPRTPAPEDAVGHLARLVFRVTGGATEPPIRISAWDSGERSAWVDGKWLDINKNYPMYRELNGAKVYLAETAILHLCKPQSGEEMRAEEYIARVDTMMSAWIRETSDSPE